MLIWERSPFTFALFFTKSNGAQGGHLESNFDRIPLAAFSDRAALDEAIAPAFYHRRNSTPVSPVIIFGNQP
jgi:hypothetical protein